MVICSQFIAQIMTIAMLWLHDNIELNL